MIVYIKQNKIKDFNTVKEYHVKQGDKLNNKIIIQEKMYVRI